MAEERLSELRWSRGAWELRETTGGLADGELLGRPHRLGGRSGQEGEPVVSLRLLDGFEIGRPRRPCGGEEGRIESVPFRGAESGVVGLPEH